ncbi:hypothetical protein SAMN04490356_7410 [Streptomyces melanosporofaciens]|uniref:Uncharacterized protein n=1 Tax=Streptomyces melanosporofaciens TaxID=67327 RepID=A0A1H4YRT0_STRMJ|nr:hypothetical protein SAMN04490356_7410 [Streptomyces melanosporofaciens]
MGEGGAVQLMRGMHHLGCGGGGGVTDQRDVVAEFHGETSGGLDAGVRQQSDEDHMGDAVLPELHIQVGVGEPALRPVLMGHHLPRPRLEVRMELPTPGVPGEAVPDHDVPLGRVGVGPRLVVTRLPAAVRDEHHPHPGLPGGADDGAQIVQQTDLLGHALHDRPDLASLGEEVVVRVDEQHCRSPGVIGLGCHDLSSALWKITHRPGRPHPGPFECPPFSRSVGDGPRAASEADCWWNSLPGSLIALYIR